MNVLRCLTLYLLPVGACRPLPCWWRSQLSKPSCARSPQAPGSDSEVHTNVSQVNDSLYLFHTPEGTPNIQIVFFHGLQFGLDYSNAHVCTWKNQDGSCIWPQKWLVEDFPRAHVLSVCYPGLEKGSNGIVDMHIIGENLVWDLLHEKIGSSCPVVFVGHSIGGLVIKQLCSYAHQMLHRTPEPNKAKLKAFLNNIKGIFFYSTPHHGTAIAKKLKKNFESPLLTYFEVLNADVARLKSAFDDISKENYKWLLAGLSETLPTNLGPFVDVVVREASARDHGEFNLMERADHFSICRPGSKKTRNFLKLAEFIRRSANHSEVEQSPLPFLHDPKYVVLKSTMMEVRQALESQTTGPIVTLSGGPGKGKTSMARYLALYYQNALTLQDDDLDTENLASDIFVDGVVFLSCGQDVDTKGLLLTLWGRMGYELLPLMGSSNCMQQAFIDSSLSNELRQRLSTRKVLIILDDVWEATVIAALLFHGKSLKYLITTQKQRLWTGIECGSDICLNPPTSEEACQILINHVYFRGRADVTPPLQDAIDRVVEKADRHPFVLASIGTHILENIQAENVDPLWKWRKAVKDFEDLMEDEDGNPSVLLFDHTYPDKYPRNMKHPMKASMTMALSRLPEKEQTLLLVASMFKTQPIPEVVFQLFFKRLHGTLAKFSWYSQHLQSNNFIQIDSAKVQLSTVPERTWSLHAMRQLFIGIVKESELKKMGNKILECNTQTDGLLVELLLLYGQDRRRDKAAKSLGIPMLQFQFAPIESFVWLLHADTEEDWKEKYHELAVQILQTYRHSYVLDDNSVSTLLSTKETCFYTVEALENFSILNPRRVVIPKTIRALVNLLESNLVNSRPAKGSGKVGWLLAQDFGKLPESMLEYTSISKVFEKLVAVLGPDGSPDAVARQFALGAFTVLIGVVRNKPSIGLFPNLIESLVAGLDKDGSQDEQLAAVNALVVLACSTLENSTTIGQFPNLIERLVELWAENVSHSAQLPVPYVLYGLTHDVENLIKIGQCPNVIERLVALLADDGLQEGQLEAVMLLSRFVEYPEFRRKIGQIPGVIERLVALLAKDVRQDIQSNATLALVFLFMDDEIRNKVPQVLNVIEGLVALLAEEVDELVKGNAAMTLSNLCLGHVENSIKIGQCPNAIERLVALLTQEVSLNVQGLAAFSLAQLCLDAKIGMKIGQFPNVMERLEALLAEDVDEDTQRNAVIALRYLCRCDENKIKIGQFPNVIERLVALLAKGGNQDVQRWATRALGELCEDAENRIQVGQVPNAIDRLVSLLREDVSQDEQRCATEALQNLAIDVKNRIKIGQFPNVIQRLVALLGEDVTQGCLAAETIRLLSLEKDCGDDEIALQAYEDRLVAIDPGYRYLLVRRWFAKANHGHFEGALADVNWFIELGGDSQLGLQERGIVKRMNGDLHGALADLDESLSLEPDDYESLKHRGLVKFLLDDENGARADAKHALNVQPASVDKYEYQLSTVLGTSSVEFLDYELK